MFYIARVRAIYSELNATKNSPNLIFPFVCYYLAKIRVMATVSTGL